MSRLTLCVLLVVCVTLLFTIGPVTFVTATYKCEPTFHSGPGPVYKPNVPHKSRYVCDPRPNGPPTRLAVIDYSSCHGICYRRDWVENPDGFLLVVRGTIKSADDCSPVGGVLMDLWQADSRGIYGSMHPNEEDAYCRGIITTNDDGTYEFETEFPGVYGMLAGLGPFGWDTLPYGPAHIHMMLYKPGFNLLVNQLLFENDTSVDHDWRQKLADADLGGHQDSVKLAPRSHPTRKGVLIAEKDFVLVRNSTAAKVPLDELIRQNMCLGIPADPAPICKPGLLPFLRWRNVAIVLAAVVAAIVFCVRSLRRGRSVGRSAAKTPTRGSQQRKAKKVD
jgi:hypothetical protein